MGDAGLTATEELALRPESEVMQLRRLGALFPNRLSFMRCLLRRIQTDHWRIERPVFDLDSDGYGTAVYQVKTPRQVFSLVIFSHLLDPELRNDRVIANAWDITMTLTAGTVDETRLELLRANVPLQEAGRLDADCIVLSRANKSVRNFEQVVDSLSRGQQPCIDTMARIGYLYRTTAVYGSGKFGMADWRKVRSRYPDFAHPFAAEMFTCYLIRQFSLDQVNFLAHCHAPHKAVELDETIARYVGIGNATGLGMAPYLLNHPLLISRWIEVREIALARCLQSAIDTAMRHRFLKALARAIRHFGEIATDNAQQNALNEQTQSHLIMLTSWLQANPSVGTDWLQVTDYAAAHLEVEAQEVVNSLVLELNPECVDDLADDLVVDEDYSLAPEMALAELVRLIESRYDWALADDLEAQCDAGVFWYRSEEKMEPRLGQCGFDSGQHWELTVVGVARAVQRCHHAAVQALVSRPDLDVADFVGSEPQFRFIVRRVQTMATRRYGDIRANLLAADVLPIHLLRCKLSFFGVSKFDPRSRLWVRNTMFQGAPTCQQLEHTSVDDWYFPVKPDAIPSAA